LTDLAVTQKQQTKKKRRRKMRKKRRRTTTLSRLCQQAHPMFPTAFHAQRGHENAVR
jgi:hypothetical protein